MFDSHDGIFNTMMRLEVEDVMRIVQKLFGTNILLHEAVKLIDQGEFDKAEDVINRAIILEEHGLMSARDAAHLLEVCDLFIERVSAIDDTFRITEECNE